MHSYNITYYLNILHIKSLKIQNPKICFIICVTKQVTGLVLQKKKKTLYLYDIAVTNVYTSGKAQIWSCWSISYIYLRLLRYRVLHSVHYEPVDI